MRKGFASKIRFEDPDPAESDDAADGDETAEIDRYARDLAARIDRLEAQMRGEKMPNKDRPGFASKLRLK